MEDSVAGAGDKGSTGVDFLLWVMREGRSMD